MKEVTLNSYSAFTIPFAGIHKETGVIVRSDGYVLTKTGFWTKGYKHQAKGSQLIYMRYSYQLNPHKRKMVHVLVAETFLRNPENKPTVDHIDRNTLNNDVFNLRFATYAEQALNTKAHLFKPDEDTLKVMQKERGRRYYIEHKDLVKQRSREWYLSHTEHAKDRRRKRYHAKKLTSMAPIVGIPKQEAYDTHNDNK